MLNAFRASLPSEVAVLLSNTMSRQLNASNVGYIKSAGRALWKRIHYPTDAVLESKLMAAHPDLPIYIINYLYGGLFSNSDYGGRTKLDRITISLFAIACLRVQQGARLQLLGHIRGLKAALKDGSWRSEHRASPQDAIEWLVSDEGCVWILSKIDELVRAIWDGPTSTFATTKARI
jgi:hypothetical protein